MPSRRRAQAPGLADASVADADFADSGGPVCERAAGGVAGGVFDELAKCAALRGVLGAEPDILTDCHSGAVVAPAGCGRPERGITVLSEAIPWTNAGSGYVDRSSGWEERVGGGWVIVSPGK